MCELDSVGLGTPDFCKAGFEAYRDIMAPHCASHTLSAFGVSLLTDLSIANVPDEVTEKLNDFACTEAEGCSRAVQILDYTYAPTEEITGYMRRNILDFPYAYTAEFIDYTRPDFEPLQIPEDLTFFNEQVLPTLGLEESSHLTQMIAGNFLDADGKTYVIAHVVYDFVNEQQVVIYTYSAYIE